LLILQGQIISPHEARYLPDLVALGLSALSLKVHEFGHGRMSEYSMTTLAANFQEA